MKKLSVKAIAAGVGLIWGESLVFGVFGAIVVLYFAGRERDLSHDPAWLGFNLLMSAMFCASGGFLAARIAKQAIYLHALLIWLIAAFFAEILSLLFSVESPAWVDLFGTILECGATFAGAYIYSNTLQFQRK